MTRATEGSLGQFEQQTAMALLALGGEAYGLQIYDKMCETSKKRVNLGGMYVTLSRLEKKGYLSAKDEPGSQARGGKARRFYKLEKPGVKALRETADTGARLAEMFYSLWSSRWRPKRAEE